MKNFKRILSVLLMMSFLIGCQDELPELDPLLSSDQLEFQITQNPNDPNMVILESFTPGIIPQWIHPMGRSTKVRDTVLLAFPNTYNFIYSVQGGGGYVSADTVVLDITTTNLSYVDDPLWDAITGGGPGNSKTWLLDIDPEGNTKYWNSPMYFSGDAWRWQGTCSNPDESVCWIWEPDWSGNQWISAANDFGTMTFSLEGGAFVDVEHTNSPGRGSESGTFFLNVDDKTIEMTDAAPLMNDWADGANVDDWSFGYLISLTDDAMQIGYKDKGKDEFIIFNYISQEYAENWVPEEEGDPEPPYDGDANSDLTTNVTTSKNWSVDLDYPYNWFDLSGNPLNEVATFGSDPEGFAFTTWAPPYDENIFSSISIELTKGGVNDGTYIIETAAENYEGNYTVNEDNIIDFGQSITFFSGVGGWLNFSTTAENTLRIIAAEEDAFGNVTGIWLGQKSADVDEYFSIHLNVAVGSGEEQDPEEVMKERLSGSAWKLDMDRSWRIDEINQDNPFIGPGFFTDFASWSYSPAPGEHYISGDVGVDYGTMSFTEDGTVQVSQLEEASTVDYEGSYSLDIENKKLSLSIPMLHPWTADYAVADWSDISFYLIEEDVLVLQALRDPDLSGEDEILMNFVFVPSE